MQFKSSTVGRSGARTRLLAYSLLGYCATMVFLGPSVAEFGLGVLGCAGSGCYGLAIFPANALAPWLNVAPPVETVFLLLQKSWFLITVWIGLIVLSVRADRLMAPPGKAQPNAARSREPRPVSSTRSASVAVQSKSALPGVIILLLAALAIFCVVLGTPLIGGLSAESILRTLGCADHGRMGSNPWSGFCGFWTERLEPYQRPWYGALLSPVWLFTQFSDVLLIWMGLILVLVLSLAYRLGWGEFVKTTPTFVKAGGLVLVVAALVGQFLGLSRLAAPPMHSDGGLGTIAGALPMVFTVGAFLVVGLAVGLFGVIALVIHLVRHLRRAPNQALSTKKFP